jgi:hypothetical protein
MEHLMDSSLEALFKAMLTDSWFINSDGNVDSPQGYFGYVTNTEAELSEIYDAFIDIVEVYGVPANNEIVGSFVARINDQGIIYIYRTTTQALAKEWFDDQVSEYIKWNDSQPLEDA